MGPTLRASCDSCNLAKVKCTKQSPQCQRCKKHNIECIYGISLRAGKRSSQIALPKKVVNRTLPPPLPLPLPTNWNMDFAATPNACSPLELDLCPPIFEYDTHFPLDGYQGIGYLDDIFHPVPDLAFSNAGMHSHPASTRTNVSTTSDPSPIMSPSMMFSPPEMLSPSHVHSIPTSLFSSCNCFRSTILTLSTLQQLEESAHTSLDSILGHNKEATALCSSTLHCGCASDSAMTLLVAALLAKIIRLYQRSGQVWESLYDYKSFNGLKRATSGYIQGQYNVNDENEERRKTQIVRTELQKVASSSRNR